MFKAIQQAVTEEYSGLRAKQYVAELTPYHRIQASPGFRAAAQRCRELLTEFGVPAEVLSFPANERTSYWSRRMFQEWEASEATLHLTEPADKACKLADFSEVKCSLIQRSAPSDALEAEVVLLEDGEDEGEYDGLDLRGKVVLTQGDLPRVHELAVGRYGAVGILFDGMREVLPVRQRLDLPDTRSYTSFWWRPGDRKCFGFVLTPRQGDALRRLIKEQQTEGKPAPRVRAKVLSRLYDGQMEVVTALIPGQSAEEVLVVAHLCHPQPSANDNASGCAAALELMRTVQRLIKQGQLSQPVRGIRLLLVPEMTGTYAYLATHEDAIERMVAGINLDMVGQNQDLCGSVFVVERTPASMASFTADLLEAMREQWLEGAQNPGASASYPLFRHTVTPFSGGSDHYILSDPAVGVPTPMLIQWPDRFWHTTDDTLDKVDPGMLAMLGGLATTYAYFVANAGSREATWLGYEMLARFRARLAHSVQNDLTEALTKAGEELARAAVRLDHKVQFSRDRQQEAAQSLLRLAPEEEGLVTHLRSEVVQTARQEMERAKEVLLWHAQQLGFDEIPPAPVEEADEWEQQAAQMWPSRLYRGPVFATAHLYRLAPQERDEVRLVLKKHRRLYNSLSTVANYWVDGKRSVAEIADLVELETGQRHVELLVRHFRLLDKLGLMAVQPHPSPSDSRPSDQRET